MLDLIAKIRAIIDDIPATPGTKSHDLLIDARTKLDRLETAVLMNPENIKSQKMPMVTKC